MKENERERERERMTFQLKALIDTTKNEARPKQMLTKKGRLHKVAIIAPAY